MHLLKNSVMTITVSLHFQKYGKKGGEGGIALAEKVLETLETKESHFHPLYSEELSLKDKIRTIAQEIYGARDVVYEPAASKQIVKIEEMGFSDFPVCMAKNQYSCQMMRRSLEDRRILISISEKSMSVPVQDSLSL